MVQSSTAVSHTKQVNTNPAAQRQNIQGRTQKQIGTIDNKRSNHHGTSARRHENGRGHKFVAINGKPTVFIATGYESYINETVGDGDCLALLKATSDVSYPSTWKPAMTVRGVTHLPIGTIIAVFDNDGNYIETDAQCTAGIYLGQDAGGLRFLVQYFGHTMVRYMMWGSSSARSLGGDFYVVAE
jgi:hypothetical protein